MIFSKAKKVILSAIFVLLAALLSVTVYGNVENDKETVIQVNAEDPTYYVNVQPYMPSVNNYSGLWGSIQFNFYYEYTGDWHYDPGYGFIPTWFTYMIKNNTTTYSAQYGMVTRATYRIEVAPNSLSNFSSAVSYLRNFMNSHDEDWLLYINNTFVGNTNNPYEESDKFYNATFYSLTRLGSDAFNRGNVVLQINPFKSISSKQDLITVRDCTTPNEYGWMLSNFLGGQLTLTTSIDMSGTSLTINNFKGSFNGNGYTIYNYKGDGFFGDNTGAYRTTIENLHLICNNSTNGLIRKCVEVDVGGTGFTIQNCMISGTINGDEDVGGIVGDYTNNGGRLVIKNCINNANITGHKNVGGIIGNANNVQIENCINYGTITAKNKQSGNVFTLGSNIGGIVGYNDAPDDWDTGWGTPSRLYNVLNLGSLNTSQSSGNNGGIVGCDETWSSAWNKGKNAFNRCYTVSYNPFGNTGEKPTDAANNLYATTTSIDRTSASAVRRFLNTRSNWNSSYSWDTSVWGNISGSSNLFNGFPYLSVFTINLTFSVGRGEMLTDDAGDRHYGEEGTTVVEGTTVGGGDSVTVPVMTGDYIDGTTNGDKISFRTNTMPVYTSSQSYTLCSVNTGDTEKFNFTFIGWCTSKYSYESNEAKFNYNAYESDVFYAWSDIDWQYYTVDVEVTSSQREYGDIDYNGTLSDSYTMGTYIYGTQIEIDGDTLTIGDKSVTAVPETDDPTYTYEFSGWSQNDGASIRSNMTVYASFTRTTNFVDLDFTVVTTTDWSERGGYFSYLGNSAELESIENVVCGTTINYSVSDGVHTITLVAPSGFDIYGTPNGTATTMSVVLNVSAGYEFTDLVYLNEAMESESSFDVSTPIMLLLINGDYEIKAYMTPIEYEIPQSYISNGEITYDTMSFTYNIEQSEDTWNRDTVRDYLRTNDPTFNAYLNREEQDFGSWIIGVNSANRVIRNEYSVDSNGNQLVNPVATTYSANVGADTMTLSPTGDTIGNWIFAFTSSFTGLDGNKYYKVTSILEGSYGDLEEGILTAMWTNTYDVNISNSGSGGIWERYRGSDKTNYVGVGGSGSGVVVSSDRKSVNLRINSSNSDVNYPFMASQMNNTYISFRTDSQLSGYVARPDRGSNYYYVYNYGYEITHWSIFFDFNGTRYYLYINAGTWAYTTNEQNSRVSIEALRSSDMDNMALYIERIDEWLGFVTTEKPVVYLIPIWAPVDIQIRDSVNNNLLGSTTYGNRYTFGDTTALSQTGKSIIYFTIANASNIIVTGDGSTVWNYKNISYSRYSANGSGPTGAIYTIRVTPVYTDNIYRVDLEADKNTGTLRLDYPSNAVDRYTMQTTSNGYSASRYDYTSFGYENYTAHGESWIEDYADYLDGYKTSYESDIESGDLSLLRKVYDIGNNLYIYLANNQPTGDLPIFEIDYFTLIYWINDGKHVNGRDQYAYTTAIYDSSIHGTVPYSQHTGDDEGIWRLEDGNGSQTIVAHYFRKDYSLSVETVLNSRLSRYGYVQIDIEDTIYGRTGSYDASLDETGSYIAIYDTDARVMRYYIYEGKSIIETIQSGAIAAPTLYAGCDITITAYDQSALGQSSISASDETALSEGYYDSFIGYRYVSMTGKNSGLSGNSIATGNAVYTATLTSEEIEGEDWATQSHFSIVAMYEEISYEADIVMRYNDGSRVIEDTSTSGSFRIGYPGGSESALLTAGHIEFTLGDVYTITYNATLGYEFEDTEFVLILPNGYTVTLQRDHWADGAGGQSYEMRVTGTWLRENYYSNPASTAYAEYSVLDADIGRIGVNTQQIVFTYAVKVYDTTDLSYTEEIVIDTNWTLNKGEVSLRDIFSDTRIEGMYKYIGGDYAVIYSHVYQPRKPSDTSMHYVAYSFPLTSEPNDTYVINVDTLRYMLEYSVGEILREDNRTIYMGAEVRPIYEMRIRTEEQAHDTNSTERVTTITNTNTNSIVHRTIGDIYSNETIGYTYRGLTNRISSEYDERYYSGARYYIDGVEIEGGSYLQEQDSEIVIHYIPRALELEIRYYINGEETSDISNIVSGFMVYAPSEIYIDSEIEIPTGYTVDSRYVMRIEINGEEVISSYIVSERDYEIGSIELEVLLESGEAGKVTIRYALSDSSKATSGDDYGTFTIYIGGEVIEGDSIEVYEGESLEIGMALNTGYVYYGYRQNNERVDTSEITDRLVLADSFNSSEDSGQYTIYIAKETVQVIYDKTGANSDNYTVLSSGVRRTESLNNTTLSGLYVGKEIEFTRLSERESEELDYYYYLDSTGARVEITGSTLTITSGLLDEIGGRDIRVGVETKNKYKLEIEVRSGADKITINTNPAIIEADSPIYYVSGTEIELTIESLSEGNYTIRTSGALTSEGDRIEGQIVLDSDKTLIVEAEAKTYAVEVSGYIYNSLEEQESGEPSELEAPASEVLIEGERYGEETTILVGRYGEGSQLTRYELRHGDGVLVIELENGEYEISSEVESKREESGSTIVTISGIEYRVTETDSGIEVRYITEGTSTLRLEYTAEKEIA